MIITGSFQVFKSQTILFPLLYRDYTLPTSQDSGFFSQQAVPVVDPDILKLSQSLLGPAVVKPESGTKDTDIRQMTMNQSLGQPWGSLMGIPPPMPGLAGIRLPGADLSRVGAVLDVSRLQQSDLVQDPFAAFGQSSKSSSAGGSPLRSESCRPNQQIFWFSGQPMGW